MKRARAPDHGRRRDESAGVFGRRDDGVLRTCTRILTVLMACTSVAVHASSPNLLTDPGAEDVSLRHWKATGGGAMLGEEGHTGWNSLRLKVPWTSSSSSPDKHRWSQIMTNFTGSVTEIFLGAWIRVTQGDAKYFTLEMAVKREGDHWSTLQLPVDWEHNYSQWTYLQASRTVNSPVKWAELKATVEGERNRADIWIDDLQFCVGLQPCSPDPATPGPASDSANSNGTPAPSPPLSTFPCARTSFADPVEADETPALAPAARSTTVAELEHMGVDPNNLISPETASRSATLPTMPPPTADAVATSRTSCPWDGSNLVMWHDPATWGGSVPTKGADVTIPAQKRVLVSSCSLDPGGYGRILIPFGSALVFADARVHLHATDVEVKGELLIGSSTCRIRTSAMITLHGKSGDGRQKGIVVSGEGKLDAFGEVFSPSWSKLAMTARRGSKALVLQHCVSWQRGQSVAITTTQFKDSRDFDWNSRAVIESVECLRIGCRDYGRITLKEELRYTHFAAEGHYQAEVGMLSRKVVFEGAADDSPPTDVSPSSCVADEHYSYPCEDSYLTGYGGHMMVGGSNAVARISSVEFRRMGQTNIVGRYPVHFHLLGEAGKNSFVEDSAIHQSYYRCIVVHGTNGTRVSRNVAFDAIGMCYYLEGGNEERNVIEHNLGAHIHPIHKTLFVTKEAQTFEDVRASSKLSVPVDIAASPFYISNLHNYVVGNAASGGWSGFAFPSLEEVIGDQKGYNDEYVPMDRPSLRIDGNSAHSTGYWWNLGACFYNGGFLRYDGSTLVYNGGRNTGKRTNGEINRRNPGKDPLTNLYRPNNFTNLQVALCSVGATDWHRASEWRNVDMADIVDRSYNAFGSVLFENTTIKCRTGNSVRFMGVTDLEESFHTREHMKMFRAYDQGQQHVISGWHVDSCNTASTRIYDSQGKRACAGIWTVPQGVNVPQFQLAAQRVTYEQPPDVYTRFACAFNASKMNSQAGSLLDVDGSLSMRNSPTIIGAGDSAAGNFWHLHEDGNLCEKIQSSWPMWMCERDSINIGYIETHFHPSKHEDQGDNWYVRAGTITHWGSTPQDAALRSWDPGTAGPYDHAHYGGWFLRFDDGAPREMEIKLPQVTPGTTLMVAFPYPAGTTFTVTARVTTSECSASKELCEEVFSKVDTSEDVRASAGNVYAFDGTYLYLSIPSVYNQLSEENDKTWAPANGLRVYSAAGITIPFMARDTFALEVKAECGGSGTFCSGSTTTVAPPACPMGVTRTSINFCGERQLTVTKKATHRPSPRPMVCDESPGPNQDPSPALGTPPNSAPMPTQSPPPYFIDNNVSDATAGNSFRGAILMYFLLALVYVLF